MGKIGLIITREFLTRVRKKSFIIMTILGPLLMGALMIVPVLLADVGSSTKIILVVDETGILDHGLKNNDDIIFVYEGRDLKKARAIAVSKRYYGVVHVPVFKDNDIRHLQQNIRFYAADQVSLGVKSYVRAQLERQIERLQLQSQNVDQALVESVKLNSNVPLPITPLQPGTSNTDVEINTILGWLSGLLIYLFIFLFGAQAMRGVIEEKTNRIVEVIISSVKPFELMMGKIIGIALVGLTQFLLWIVLTGSIYSVFTGVVIKDKYSAENIQQMMMKSPEGTGPKVDEAAVVNQLLDGIGRINWEVILPFFIFYFIFGYLLYGALFAAIGSAVDSEADTQQFMLPITIPLIFSFVMAQAVVNEPAGALAKWLSIFPFTSPVIMMVRLPFGVPVVELILSALALIAGFVGTTWLAGKIYRTGILMYGKRVSWSELIKWLRY
ncbi:MAG: ABC transporter permease [Bacteroidia bacterium]|nr:ABC transporter permease [Bacteroidia bacterium]MCC6768664.1 ABC transporter permease [Bacteroidia bacterium]